MKAMLLRGTAPLAQNPTPLSFEGLPEPKVEAGEILIRVTACGVCHTELDEIEGRVKPKLPIVLGHQVVGVVESVGLPTKQEQAPVLQISGVCHTELDEIEGRMKPKLPIVLGHQIVGVVESVGLPTKQEQAPALQIGQRVGVAWIASACGKCEHCLSGDENLCAEFKATGRDIDGGYAEYMKVRADFAHPIPSSLSDSEAAPLLCAGAIGYRSLRLANIQDGQSLGLTGFGGSNHLVLKMAKHKYPNTKIFVFSRNVEEREFALSLGATWAGTIDQNPPIELEAVIDTTPVWGPLVDALKHLSPGGRVIVNAIRKEEADKEVLMKLDYPSQLWMEKEIKSVANVTRADVREFLGLAAEADIRPEFQEFDLKDANRALAEMKQGKIRGSKVLRVG